MDLNDVWQENKRFILAIGVAFVGVLVGKAVIGSVWDFKAPAAASRSWAARLRKLDAPPQAEVTRIAAMNEQLSQQVGEAAARAGFVTGSRYLLAPDERSPELAYDAIRARAVEDLVGVARRRNIHVDESLGLPDFTPQGREQIQRYLHALDVVEQVVTACIVAGVREVDQIEVLEAKKRARRGEAVEEFIDPVSVRFRIAGTTAAIAEVVGRVVRHEPGRFLAVDEAEISVDEVRGMELTALECTVSALRLRHAGMEAGP